MSGRPRHASYLIVDDDLWRGRASEHHDATRTTRVARRSPGADCGALVTSSTADAAAEYVTLTTCPKRASHASSCGDRDARISVDERVRDDKAIELDWTTAIVNNEPAEVAYKSATRPTTTPVAP